MDPIPLAILLFAVGAVLLVLEALLPAAGIIGAGGVLAVLGAIGVCFRVSPSLGLGALIGAALLTPIAWSLWVKLWPRTPMGRRLILQTVAGGAKPAAAVRVGQAGTTVSELRPAGECEFAGERVEAYSEGGVVPAGRPVRAVSVTGGRVLVRPV